MRPFWYECGLTDVGWAGSQVWGQLASPQRLDGRAGLCWDDSALLHLASHCPPRSPGLVSQHRQRSWGNRSTQSQLGRPGSALAQLFQIIPLATAGHTTSKFKGWRNRPHLLMGRITKSHCKQTGVKKLLYSIYQLLKYKRIWHIKEKARISVWLEPKVQIESEKDRGEV